MFSAMATFLRRRPRQPAVIAPVSAPELPAPCPSGTSDPEGGLVAVPVLSRAVGDKLPPGALYVTPAGQVCRAPPRHSTIVSAPAFAQAFATWLAEHASDISTSWDEKSFAEFAAWFASENRLAPHTVEAIAATPYFERAPSGNFVAAPRQLKAEAPKPAPISPTAERMIDLLGQTKRPLTVKEIAERLNVCSAPVSRAITRHLQQQVTATRKGREVFVALRNTGERVRAAA